MRPTTIKSVDVTEGTSVSDVHVAVAAALTDEEFSSTVVDGRILWTVSDDEIHTYFRTYPYSGGEL